MAMLLAAKVWTYWISYFLLVPAVLMVVLTAVGYLVKVQAKKYPRR
jgi:ascorbate-specific PTS system EIIC-type component UlaA